MAFPTTRLPVTVEMAFGATGSPLGWTWTDVTSRLEAQSIGIRRGRPDEGGNLQPASVSLELENNDGALMPGNPGSPYWPNVVRGTPLRISVDGAEAALLCNGNGFATTPDHADFHFSGDLDVRVRLQPDHWSNGVQWSNGSRVFLADLQRLVSRWLAPSNKAWNFHLYGAGWPAYERSSDGTLSFGNHPGQLVAAAKPIWFGMTIDVDNGATGHTVRWYRWDTAAAPADITTWTVVGEVTTSGTTSLYAASTAPVAVGGLAGFSSFRGRIFAAQIRNGINGTLVANPVFSAQTPGAGSFIDSTGKVWTLTGQAAISTRRPRFVGTVDEIVPTWPHGDHNAASPTQPSEARVQITASDLVRRLGQGSKALRSSLYRHITSTRYASNVTAYWPCEDESGAVQLAAGKAGVGPITLTGKISAGADSTLAASAGLPSAQANEAVRFVATVPAGGPTTKWTVEWLAKVAALPAAPTSTLLLAVLSNGTARQWRIELNSTLLAAEVVNNDGAVIAGASVGVPNLSGEWMLWRLDASESAGTITWAIDGTILSAGTGVVLDGAFSGTLGAVAGFDTSTTAPPDGMSFGHIIAHDGNLPVGWLAGPDTAWVGESAAHRIWRLCTEEGIPVEVVGETSGYSTLRGEIAYSEPMGPQSRSALLTLIAQAAGVDLGAIGTRRGAPGFAYRTRKTLENQAAALTLNAAANHITRPLEPRLDDQRLRNDITVASTAGSSSRAVNTASTALEGLYGEQLTINGVGGVQVQSAILAGTTGLSTAVESQNLQQAGWRLALGVWPGLRYPTVSIDLGTNPTLIPAFHDLEVGDRVTLTGLPDQHPTGTIDLLVEGFTERLTPTTWLVNLTCSPGGPWQVGALDA